MFGRMNKEIVKNRAVTQYMARSQNLLVVAEERHEAKSAGHLAATYGFGISNVTDNRYDIWDRLRT
jgi:hypothetical protein